VPNPLASILARRNRWDWAAYGAACVAFAYFYFFRMRYVGACDWSSYYLESLRFRGIDALHIDPSLPFKGALAPLCMNLVAHDRIVSLFPPGFPLLLALSGALRFAFAMNPLIGALSGVTLYHLIKPRVPGHIAFVTSVLWLSSPLVFFGATEMMSDLPATEFCMLAVLALEHELPILAGVVLGAALGIRPACILMAPVLVALSPRLKPILRVALGGLIAVGCWVVFLRLELGGSRVPYSMNFGVLTGAIFSYQLWFLVKTAAVYHLPQFLLAAVGTAVGRRRALPYVLWFAVFALFHAFWAGRFDAWWWTRYVMPALPGVHILAADGIALIERKAAHKSRVVKEGPLALAALYAAWSYFASPATPAHTTDLAQWFKEDSERVAKIAPRGALIGAVNYSGPLRFYGGVQSFFICHPESRSLIDWALKAQRAVLALVVIGESDCGSFEGKKLTPVESLKSGFKLIRIEEAPSQKLDIGTPEARPNLLEGWSNGDETAGGVSFVWAIGHRVVLRPPDPPGAVPVQVTVTLSPYLAAAPASAPRTALQHLDVVAAGEKLGSFDLTAGYQTVSLAVPARLNKVPLELDFAYAAAPFAGNSKDVRAFAAAVDSVTFTYP